MENRKSYWPNEFLKEAGLYLAVGLATWGTLWVGDRMGEYISNTGSELLEKAENAWEETEERRAKRRRDLRDIGEKIRDINDINLDYRDGRGRDN